MTVPDNFAQLQEQWRRRPTFRIRWALYAFGGLLLLIAVFSSYYTVAPDGQAVVKRFGRVVGIREPGLHFKLPFGIDAVYFVPIENVLKEEFGFRTGQLGQRTTYESGPSIDAITEQESLMLTGDLSVVDVEWVVQYTINNPERYLHSVRDPRETIRDIAESVMRRSVGNRLGSAVLTIGRVSVASESRDLMQEILDSYDIGVHVSAVQLQDVTPPGRVKPAFNEVNNARQNREQSINNAEKERNQKLPRAHGEAEQTVSEAVAYATERINRAQGEAQRFTAIRTEYEKAQDVTRRRLFLEMVDKVLPSVTLYVLDETGNAPLPLLDLNGARSGVRNGEQR